MNYILTYYDIHHTLDGGVVTKYVKDEQEARDHLDYLERTTCHQHPKVQTGRQCIRDVQLTEVSTTTTRRRIF